MTGVPFRDVLRLGTRGTQPVAVKRGLWHAGFKAGWDALDGVAIAAEVLGSTAVANLKVFQHYWGLAADGVYGPRSHEILRGSFDDYAVALYTHDPPPPGATVQLPATFTPTHNTAGLPVPGAPPGSLTSFAYPAIDVFATPGAMALAPQDCRIARLSGRDPAAGGKPHGAYGWSVYAAAPHAVYFLTHFAALAVELGQQLRRGEPVGTVCDAAVAQMPSSASHIHEGRHDF